MYKLTLTQSERQAIDWIGNRYNHGDDFYKLLIQCDYEGYNTSCAWDDANDLTFIIPEHIAWDINELFRENDYTFDCFNNELSSKLLDFCLSIV